MTAIRLGNDSFEFDLGRGAESVCSAGREATTSSNACGSAAMGSDIRSSLS